MVYDCELSLNLKFGNETGKINLSDVNNHENDAEFEFEYKITDDKMRNAAKNSKKQIQEYIKELFKLFHESQKLK